MRDNLYIYTPGTLTLTDFLLNVDTIAEIAYKGPHYPCVFSREMAFFTEEQTGHTKSFLLNIWDGQTGKSFKWGPYTPESSQDCIWLIKKALSQYPSLSDYYIFVPRARLRDSIWNQPGLIKPHRPDNDFFTTPNDLDDRKHNEAESVSTEKPVSAPGGP